MPSECEFASFGMKIFTTSYATADYRIRCGTDIDFNFIIMIQKQFDGDYAIAQPIYNVHATANYKILHNANSNFVLEIYDPIFTSDQFYNLNIQKKLMQVDALSVTLFNVSSESATTIRQNYPLRLRINGRFLFAGIIKRVERDDNKRTWNIWAESNACILRDFQIQSEIEYKNQYILQTIIPNILPGDNTWLLTYDGIDMDKKVDYKMSSGGSLTHISNLCKFAGWEWMCWIENDTYTVSSVFGSSVNIMETIPSTKYSGGYGIIPYGSAKNTGFIVSTASGNTITTNTDLETEGLEVGDKITIWGKNVLYITDRLGSSDITLYATQNYNISSLVFSTNLDKSFTNVISSGVTPGMIGYLSQATDNNYTYGYVNTNESYLVENVSNSTLTLWVNDGSLYQTPQRYFVDDEIISIQSAIIADGATSWRLEIGSIDNRGMEGTTATSHYANVPVLCYKLLPAVGVYDSTNAKVFSDPGTVWIGNEKIHYEYCDAYGFHNLDRGYEDTISYAHGLNTMIRDAQYDAIPSPNSWAAEINCGVRSGRFEAFGINSKDSIDKYVGNIMLKTSSATEYGSFTLLETDIWKTYAIGDNISITRDVTIIPSTTPYIVKVTSTNRLVGVEYNQFQPLKITFGAIDNYILDSFSKLDYSKDLAAQKGYPEKTATILRTSSDGKMAYVKYTDGTMEWVEAI